MNKKLGLLLLVPVLSLSACGGFSKEKAKTIIEGMIDPRQDDGYPYWSITITEDTDREDMAYYRRRGIFEFAKDGSFHYFFHRTLLSKDNGLTGIWSCHFYYLPSYQGYKNVIFAENSDSYVGNSHNVVSTIGKTELPTTNKFSLYQSYCRSLLPSLEGNEPFKATIKDNDSYESYDAYLNAAVVHYHDYKYEFESTGDGNITIKENYYYHSKPIIETREIKTSSTYEYSDYYIRSITRKTSRHVTDEDTATMSFPAEIDYKVTFEYHEQLNFSIPDNWLEYLVD